MITKYRVLTYKDRIVKTIVKKMKFGFNIKNVFTSTSILLFYLMIISCSSIMDEKQIVEIIPMDKTNIIAVYGRYTSSRKYFLLKRIDLKENSVIWRIKIIIRDPGFDNDIIDRQINHYSINNNYLVYRYSSTRENKLKDHFHFCIDTGNGEVLWKKDLPVFYSLSYLNMIQDSSKVYYFYKKHPDQNSFFIDCYQTESGQLLWQEEIDYSSPVLVFESSEYLFIRADSNEEIYASVLIINKKNGSVNSIDNVLGFPVFYKNFVICMQNEWKFSKYRIPDMSCESTDYINMHVGFSINYLIYLDNFVIIDSNASQVVLYSLTEKKKIKNFGLGENYILNYNKLFYLDENNYIYDPFFPTGNHYIPIIVNKTDKNTIKIVVLNLKEKTILSGKEIKLGEKYYTSQDDILFNNGIYYLFLPAGKDITYNNSLVLFDSNNNTFINSFELQDKTTGESFSFQSVTPKSIRFNNLYISEGNNHYIIDLDTNSIFYSSNENFIIHNNLEQVIAFWGIPGTS